MINITGEEDSKMIKQIAKGMSDQLFEGASSGNREQMNAALDITYWQAIYCLGSLVFNQSMIDANHNINNIQMKIMLNMDKVKEDIMAEVDRMIEGFKKGELNYVDKKEG